MSALPDEARAGQDRVTQAGAHADELRAILFRSGAAGAWEWLIGENRIVGDAGFAQFLDTTTEDAAAGLSPTQFFAAIDAQDRDRMRLAIAGMLRGAQVLSKECRLVRADARLRWVHAHGWSEMDDAGAVTRLSGVLVDITEQKRLEEQLRIAQSAGGIGTFEHVDGFGTVSVSPYFCTLLGLRIAPALPVRTINAVVVPGDPPLIDLAPAREPGTTSFADFRIVRPDTGERRWLTRRGEYVRAAEATGIRFSGVIYDITETKRTEAQLRALNDRLEGRVEERTRERDRIWRISQHLLGVADAEGRWLDVSPAWKALLGWDESEIVGRTTEWLWHPDDIEENTLKRSQLASGAKTLSFEKRLRGRDGAYRWVSWTAMPEQGAVYFVGKDVTAEKEAAQTLAKAEEQLRQSQKMEAVGQLTGGLAHDFNNLLTGVIGSLDLVQTRLAQGRLNELDRFVTAAQGACKRAAALTHRLLAFSRQQTLEPKPTDVNQLIAGMDDLLRRTMGPSVTVEVITAGGLWPTLVDQNQLENALLNLCINARDAMPDGGRLVIEPANRWLDERAGAERDLPPGQYVSLSVSDNGCGMPPDVVARAFDPFFTTKPIGQGTGLGLSMIYGFARQSGGQARIYSEVGHGTVVSIYLPRHFGGSEHAAPTPEPLRVLPAEHGETVLVVDDEPTVRMLVTEVLSDLECVALEANDGPSALNLLRSDLPIDLLVTDVGLPGGMTGRQLADAARALRPGLKVLFITGYAENAVLNHGHLEPGMHVLTKPFAMNALASRIKLLISNP